MVPVKKDPEENSEKARKEHEIQQRSGSSHEPHTPVSKNADACDVEEWVLNGIFHDGMLDPFVFFASFPLSLHSLGENRCLCSI